MSDDDLTFDLGDATAPPGVDLWDETPAPWRTKGLVDIIEMIQPRRPELLGDADREAWAADLHAWSSWLIQTFQLQSTFPPCWTQHGALVEELTALWLGWSGVWLSGTDPTGPSSWHYQLDMAVQRIPRWKVSCDSTVHTPDRTFTHYEPRKPTWSVWYPAKEQR
ncbi:MAG: hypothetical protein ABMA25_02500 [Ilumatobacteraceae bacterium]